MKIALTLPPIELELTPTAERALMDKIGLSLSLGTGPHPDIDDFLRSLAQRAAAEMVTREVNQITTDYLLRLGQEEDERRAQVTLDFQRLDPCPHSSTPTAAR